MQIKRQVTSPPSPWQQGEGKKKRKVFFDLVDYRK